MYFQPLAEMQEGQGKISLPFLSGGWRAN